eukprot:TRINITY_DN39263_c0_g1_i1.p1 TRINITY_DN39263_c0_g1~~TRINITY_DN39263_c0_g1_i1.p1  ORF type:complete len:439 (+),score=100.63 TRINITY_DN39263_c0_g1_i1:51-1367(+)
MEAWPVALAASVGAALCCLLRRPRTRGLEDYARVHGKPVRDAPVGDGDGPVVACADPPLTLLPGFLSEAECRHLIEMADARRWAQSSVGSSRAGDASSRRTSSSAILDVDADEVLTGIAARAATAAGCHPDQVERLNVVRYLPGQYFRLHHDGRFRTRTVFIYLSDCAGSADAGCTVFPVLGVRVRPRVGLAAMWPNAVPGDGGEDLRVIHEAAPPDRVKYGVNVFVNELPVRCIERAAKKVAAAHSGVEAALAVRPDGVWLMFLQPFRLADAAASSESPRRVAFSHPLGMVCFEVAPAGGALMLTVDGSERPPFTVLRWEWTAGPNHGWLVMPEIGRRIEPPLDGLAETLQGLRLLAGRAGVDCNIGLQPRVGLRRAKKLLFTGAGGDASNPLGTADGLRLSLSSDDLRGMCRGSWNGLDARLEERFAALLKERAGV